MRKNVIATDSSDPPAISSHARKCLLIHLKKIPLLAGTHHIVGMTCGPTKLTGMEGFVNLVNINDSSCSNRRCPSNGHSASSTSGLLAPAAQSSAGRAACSCVPWPAVLPRRTHRPYYSHRWPGPVATAASDRSRTSEPSYSSPRGLPLLRLPRLRTSPS